MDKTRVIWEYPESVRSSLPPLTFEQRRADIDGLLARLSETIARIDERIAVEAALRKEKEAALAWCRENGNPHQPKDQPHD